MTRSPSSRHCMNMLRKSVPIRLLHLQIWITFITPSRNPFTVKSPRIQVATKVITRNSLRATKVRKLRKKFKDNIAAGKTNLLIKDNKTHDQNVYQLSNDIWGLMDLNSKCVVNNKLKMKSTLSFEGHGMDAFVKKCGLSLRMFEGDTKKKAILEERWNKFKLSQLDASRRQAAFKRKLMQFALESFQ
uniref:Glabrous enhancer-binding protein-like DBD domain-containing protein n=1 Tax=Fagus sylvatica TaxID=28930 RepID=A0A2N9HPG0_FAGSY